MINQQKQWIDNADYESLLRRWRNALSGDVMFQGDTGEYYSKVMTEKRDQVGNDTHIRASKNIGWD